MKKQVRSQNPTKLRYAAEAAYPRGNETRARLISAAITLFGQRGFDAASTREIAASAALNTPALQYYFNNKEGLYVACAEHIAAKGWEAMREVIVFAERLLAAGADDDALIEAYCDSQGRLAEFLNGANGDWLLWMSREQTVSRPHPGFLVNHRSIKRIIKARRAIIARLLGRSARDPESVVHEMMLTGELMRFYTMRGGALHMLGWKTISEEGLALIKRVSRLHSMAALRAMVGERDQKVTRGPPGRRVRPGKAMSAKPG
jgi:AcrR family transcriptional regulator